MRLEDSAGGRTTEKAWNTTTSVRETEHIRGNGGNVHKDFSVLKIATAVKVYTKDYPFLSVVRLQYKETDEAGFVLSTVQN